MCTKVVVEPNVSIFVFKCSARTLTDRYTSDLYMHHSILSLNILKAPVASCVFVVFPTTNYNRFKYIYNHLPYPGGNFLISVLPYIYHDKT